MMKPFVCSLLMIMMSLSILPSWAATVIARENAQGKTETVTLDSQQARIDFARAEHYMLLDLQQQKSYAINKKEKIIVEMAFTAKPPPQAAQQPHSQPKVKAEWVQKGEGPKIAGYPTVHYQLTANGKPCSDDYFSEQAAKIDTIKAFLKAMSELSQSRQPQGMPMHPCQQAHHQLEQQALAKGVPMKSVTVDGKIRHQIQSIKTDVKVKAAQLSLPKDYQQKTEQQMITEMQQKMREYATQRPPADRLSEDPYRRPPPPSRSEDNRDEQDRWPAPRPGYRSDYPDY